MRTPAIPKRNNISPAQKYIIPQNAPIKREIINFINTGNALVFKIKKSIFDKSITQKNIGKRTIDGTIPFIPSKIKSKISNKNIIIM